MQRSNTHVAVLNCPNWIVGYSVDELEQSQFTILVLLYPFALFCGDYRPFDN